MKRRWVRHLLAYWLAGYLGSWVLMIVYVTHSLHGKIFLAMRACVPLLWNVKMHGISILMGFIWPGMLLVTFHRPEPAFRYGALPSYMGTYVLLQFLIWRLAPRAIPAGQCPNCGYDLRATPNQCPECGVVVSSQAVDLSSDPGMTPTSQKSV
jgi:hypothetical protein